ncbi:hypothetical protein BBJ28_00017091 [Nothophytophthora sp. Chile5]|nr:hypothetical protein BBJ28_00017091 [Nothophytophthora sp. Chile5]
MSTEGIGFGEYEALLPCIGAGALTFSRELFSREYVVQSVAQDTLAVAGCEVVQGLARLHPGHVAVSVDGVPVRGLSWRRFAALWQQQPAPEASVSAIEDSSASALRRRVRFRDRKRADLEMGMQKDWTASSPTVLKHLPDIELQAKLREIHALIWRHELTQAHAALHTLPVGSDPLVCLLAAELEAVRVLVSNDSLYAKQAQRAANRAVTWLQSLCELSSLSYSSRTQARVALAEALFLLALLRLGAEQRLAAATTARRCAALYVELSEELLTGPEVVESKAKMLLMPGDTLRDLQARVHFGLGVLHVGGALALQSAHEWIGTMLHGTCDPSKGLQYLLSCCNATDDSHSNLRANWAALALLHSSGAIRLVRQRDPNGEGSSSDFIVQAIHESQGAVLQRHPKALLFLWSQATTTAAGAGCRGLEELEATLVRLSVNDERMHLVRFEVGYRRFLDRDFDRSETQFALICKCTSAPPKLRGLSSLFLAVGYLLLPRGTDGSASDSKLLGSVRLLLRSARRFLALAMEREGGDPEAASLHERLGAFVAGSDVYLQLFPWEMLYVFCYSSTTAATSKATDLQHVDALERLDQLSGAECIADYQGGEHEHQAERGLLRAIILFHLRDLDACDDELQQLWTRWLPPGGRCRSNSGIRGRFSSQEIAPPSFVAPVAWFYQLRLLLERRGSTSAVASSPKASINPTAHLRSSWMGRMLRGGQAATSSYESAEQRQHYPYQHIYGGKLQALNKLVARLAHDKIDNNVSHSICTHTEIRE